MTSELAVFDGGPFPLAEFSRCGDHFAGHDEHADRLRPRPWFLLEGLQSGSGAHRHSVRLGPSESSHSSPDAVTQVKLRTGRGPAVDPASRSPPRERRRRRRRRSGNSPFQLCRTLLCIRFAGTGRCSPRSAVGAGLNFRAARWHGLAVAIRNPRPSTACGSCRTEICR